MYARSTFAVNIINSKTYMIMKEMKMGSARERASLLGLRHEQTVRLQEELVCLSEFLNEWYWQSLDMKDAQMYQDPAYREQRWERLQHILLGGPGYGDGLLQEKMNRVMNQILRRLSADIPTLSEREYFAFTYFAAGFSNRLVTHLAGLSSTNATAVLKCRMKDEFIKLSSPYKFEYLELLKPHKLSNWQRNAIFARLK